MRSVSRRRAADFVRPALSEARVSRMWSAVTRVEEERLARRGRRRQAAAVMAAVVALAVLASILVALRRWPAPPPTLAGLLIDTGSATQVVSLPEGSTLTLAAATRLRVISASPGEIRLRVERGSMLCDVVHREERRFIVEAKGIEVEDRGTRFAVDVQEDVTVRVEQGAVEVHDTSRFVLSTLTAGQAWRSGGPVRLGTMGAERSAPLPSPPPEAIAPTAEPVVPASSPPPKSPGDDGGRAPKPPGSGLCKVPSRKVLFERADAARLAGRHADAASDFARFYHCFPGDPRAGLAAYELGRIRLGSLHDPRGAAEAFGAVLERPGDPFREDAEAGRVEALADLGDEHACQAARDAFRAAYPGSPQAGRVARLCRGP